MSGVYWNIQYAFTNFSFELSVNLYVHRQVYFWGIKLNPETHINHYQEIHFESSRYDEKRRNAFVIISLK